MLLPSARSSALLRESPGLLGELYPPIGEKLGLTFRFRSWVLFFALFPLAAAALKSKPEEKKHKEVEHF